MQPTAIILLGMIIFIFIMFISTIKIVPQRQAFIIERLGKYRTSLQAGFHIILPFIDKVSYKHSRY